VVLGGILKVTVSLKNFVAVMDDWFGGFLLSIPPRFLRFSKHKKIEHPFLLSVSHFDFNNNSQPLIAMLPRSNESRICVYLDRGHRRTIVRSNNSFDRDFIS
jgi:hypothetical protein